MAKKPDCSELAATIAKLAFNIAESNESMDLDAVAAEIAKIDPRIDLQTVVDSMNDFMESESSKRTKKVLSNLSKVKQDARTRRSERSRITSLEKQIEDGVFDKPTPKAAKAASEAVTVLRKHRKKLERKSNLHEQITDLTRQLETGEFTPKRVKSSTTEDVEIQDLSIDRHILQSELRGRIADMRPFKMADIITGPGRFAQEVSTAFDISALGRQGGLVMMGSPDILVKTFLPTLEKFASERAFRKAELEITQHPLFRTAITAGLEITSFEGPLNKTEENASSRIAKKVPGVRGSSRAYVGALNSIRMQKFAQMVYTGKGGAPMSPAEMKEIAHFVNTMTGRGDATTKFGRIIGNMNGILWAPKLFLSRVQYLNLLSLRKAGSGGAGFNRVRRRIALEYGKTMIGYGAFLGLLWLGAEMLFPDEEKSFEFDPRSSDFMKFKVGNTRYDLGTGLFQIITLGTRLVTGQTKSRGKVRKTGRGDAADRFFQNKQSPLASFVDDFIRGKDFDGRKFNFVNAVNSRLTPLVIQDFIEVWEEEGLDKASITALLVILGISVQAYGSEPRPRVKLPSTGQRLLDQLNPIKALKERQPTELEKLLGLSGILPERSKVEDLVGN